MFIVSKKNSIAKYLFSKAGGINMFYKKNSELPIDLIYANPEQPRKHFSEEEIDELANSIKEYGVLQPIIVSKMKEGKYFLIAGERRLRASIKVGLNKIPAIIKEASDRDIALIALVENVQRENLSYIEEAIAYKKLMIDFDLSQTEIAKRVGKQQSTISNKIRLLSMPEDVIEMLLESQLTERHARALLRVDDNELRKNIIKRVVTNNLNVKQTEKLIEDILSKKEEEDRKKHKLRFINYKLYLNSIRKTFEQIKEIEENATYHQTDLGECMEIKILIPKNSSTDKAV